MRNPFDLGAELRKKVERLIGTGSPANAHFLEAGAVSKCAECHSVPSPIHVSLRGSLKKVLI